MRSAFTAFIAAGCLSAGISPDWLGYHGDETGQRYSPLGQVNTSNIRRCGWTMRFTSSKVKFNQDEFDGAHVVYLAKGRDLGGNQYADPTRAYPEVMEKRGMSRHYRNSH